MGTRGYNIVVLIINQIIFFIVGLMFGIMLFREISCSSTNEKACISRCENMKYNRYKYQNGICQCFTESLPENPNKKSIVQESK